MGGSLKEESVHAIDRGSTSNKGEQPVKVVKVRRVRKAGQEGVKSEELDIRRCVDVKKEAFVGKTESRLEGFGERVGETLRVEEEEESEVEVIKKEGRVNMKEDRMKGGDEVGSKCRNQTAQSRSQEKKVRDHNLGERGESGMTQCKRETRVLGTNGGKRQAMGLEKEVGSETMWPCLDAVAHQDDLMRCTSQNLESDIDAKLKELKLKSTGGGFEEELAQDTRSTPAVVEVEEMTSEDYYYDPLGHFAAHEETLKDESRMLIWQQVRQYNSLVSENFH